MAHLPPCVPELGEVRPGAGSRVYWSWELCVLELGVVCFGAGSCVLELGVVCSGAGSCDLELGVVTWSWELCVLEAGELELCSEGLHQNLVQFCATWMYVFCVTGLGVELCVTRPPFLVHGWRPSVITDEVINKAIQVLHLSTVLGRTTQPPH